jgi:hypothetical protein
MGSLSHRGTGFEVWHNQGTWFWLVVSQHRGGGAIGAAPNEADAIREARSSIEEMFLRGHNPDTKEKSTCDS